MSLIDSLQALSERPGLSALTLPQPWEGVKDWPVVGDQIFQFWELASNNFHDTLTNIAPYLKPVGSNLLQIAAGAGTGAVKFLIAIILAGFLYAPAPSLVSGVRKLSHKLALGRGEEFIRLAVATIRAVSRGVIGISALQALLAGLGLTVAGVPGASLITSAVLVLGIIQIGPSIILIPLILWGWITMETTAALLFMAYMVPVSLLDNILRPLVLGRGLTTPMLVILIGVIGGTISYGITGLFLGPIVLAVIWELLTAWVKEEGPAG